MIRAFRFYVRQNGKFSQISNRYCIIDMFIYTSMEALINSESLHQAVYIAGSLASEEFVSVSFAHRKVTKTRREKERKNDDSPLSY